MAIQIEVNNENAVFIRYDSGELLIIRPYQPIDGIGSAEIQTSLVGSEIHSDRFNAFSIHVEIQRPK